MGGCGRVGVGGLRDAATIPGMEGWGCGDLQVVEDPSDDHGIAEERHHLHAPAALAAEQSVEKEHAVEELGPTQTTAAAGGVRAV